MPPRSLSAGPRSRDPPSDTVKTQMSASRSPQSPNAPDGKNSLSLSRQHAAELAAHSPHEVSEAPFAVVRLPSSRVASVAPISNTASNASAHAPITTGVFQDIAAAPRSRSKSRTREEPPPFSLLSVASRVSSSAAPALSPDSSRVTPHGAPPAIRDPHAVSLLTSQSRSRSRPRDDAPSSYASAMSSAAASTRPSLQQASTAVAAPSARRLISSAAAARPSPFASAAPASQTERDRARAHRQAIADALAGVIRPSNTDSRLGDC